MKPIIVCGSLAYDTIMLYSGHFKEQIISGGLDRINASFYAPDVAHAYGGTAGNISYNLSLLGVRAEVLATIGRDGGEYCERLAALGIGTTSVRMNQEKLTAHAYILTDSHNNQITTFHPGALNAPLHAHPLAHLPESDWAIVAPDSLAAMTYLMPTFRAQGTRAIFDPGQALPLFDSSSLTECINDAHLSIMNEHEHAMLLEKLGPNAEATMRGKNYIVTRGASGADAYVGDITFHVSCGTPDKIADATGCGDAFRAGLLYGLSREWPLQEAMQLGATMGAIAVGSESGQNHVVGLDEIKDRYAHDFGVWPTSIVVEAA
jgi:adenosine kinase